MGRQVEREKGQGEGEEEGEGVKVEGEWRMIECGRALKGGSWGRAVVQGGKLVVLGGAGRDILDDYARRETHFSDVAIVSLDAFGITQPLPALLPDELQQLALATLADPHLADFELVALDGSMSCSKHLLDARWPWFRAKLAAFSAHVGDLAGAQDRRHDALGSASRKNSLAPAPTQDADDAPDSPASPSPSPVGLRIPRVLSPRRLAVPARLAVVRAMVEFVYAGGLVTAGSRGEGVARELLVWEGVGVGEGRVEGLREAVLELLGEGLEGGAGVEGAFGAAVVGGAFGLQIVSSRV